MAETKRAELGIQGTAAPSMGRARPTRSYTVALHFGEQRFGQHSSDARSLLVGSDGDDHERSGR